MADSTRRLEQDLRRQIREREARKQQKLTSLKRYKGVARKVDNRLQRFGSELQRRDSHNAQRAHHLEKLEGRLDAFHESVQQAQADGLVQRYKSGEGMYNGTNTSGDQFLRAHHDLAREADSWNHSLGLWVQSEELQEAKQWGDHRAGAGADAGSRGGGGEGGGGGGGGGGGRPSSQPLQSSYAPLQHHHHHIAGAAGGRPASMEGVGDARSPAHSRRHGHDHHHDNADDDGGCGDEGDSASASAAVAEDPVARRLREIEAMHRMKDKYDQAVAESRRAVEAKRDLESDAAKLALELNSPAAQQYDDSVREAMEEDLREKRMEASMASAKAAAFEARAEKMQARVMHYGYAPGRDEASIERSARRVELNGILALTKPRSSKAHLLLQQHRQDQHQHQHPQAEVLVLPREDQLEHVDLSREVEARQKQMFVELMERIGDGTFGGGDKSGPGSGGARGGTAARGRSRKGKRPGSPTIPGDEETKSMSFDQLVGLGNFIKTKDVLDVREHKQQRQNDIEDEQALEFARQRQQAAMQLAALASGEGGAGAGASGSGGGGVAGPPAAARAPPALDPLLAYNIIRQTPISSFHKNAPVFNLDVTRAPVRAE
jgi:hypothetical protein